MPGADVRAIPLYILEPIELERIQTPIPEILFVAGFNHPPNIDGAIWFVTGILPLIREQVGDRSGPDKLDSAISAFQFIGSTSQGRVESVHSQASALLARAAQYLSEWFEYVQTPLMGLIVQLYEKTSSTETCQLPKPWLENKLVSSLNSRTATRLQIVPS